MIDKLMDRVPEDWARRWARRTNRLHVVFMVAYLGAWWFAGLQAWANDNLTEAEAALLGFAWTPVMVVWLIFQSLDAHHSFKRMAKLHEAANRAHLDALDYVQQVYREADAFRARLMGEDAPDAPLTH
jgi:hypothetical protein